MWQIAKMSKFNNKYQGGELWIFTNLCKLSSSSTTCTELETIVIAQHMVSFRRKCKANLKQVREVQLGEWLINVQMLLTVGGIRLCGGHQTIFPGQSSRTASINFKFVCSWDTMKTNPQDWTYILKFIIKITVHKLEFVFCYALVAVTVKLNLYVRYIRTGLVWLSFRSMDY